MILSKLIRTFMLVIVGLFLIPGFLPDNSIRNVTPASASYNPVPADNYHAPLSSAALMAVTGARPSIQGSNMSSTQSMNSSNSLSGPKRIDENAIRFISDKSYFPQSETTIAVDPANPNHVLGGFQDTKYFFCQFLPGDCSTVSTSLSGFTVSIDGGHTVAKVSDLPSINVNRFFLVAWGDPSVAASVDGNFYYATLAINRGGSTGGNGILLAKSNSSLFEPTISCATPYTYSTSNPCWKTVFVYGSADVPVFTLEDKDRIAVDQDPTSPYYGSVYIGWDHFLPLGGSQSYVARCDRDLLSCVLISGGDRPAVSGSDSFVAYTTPTVDKNGNLHVAWCNFGTFTTLGPVTCRIASSPPGGIQFGPPTNITSYMGSGTTLPSDTVVVGWATEQFRVAAGLISISADNSPKSNNLYFTTQVCTQGHFYKFPSYLAPVADDNPGECEQSAVIISQSADSGLSWSSPTIVSRPAVNDQPFVTVDPERGTVYLVYYTTQYDSFNHRIDVVAAISNNAGRTFHQERITTVSNEPDSDPNMYDYVAPAGFGGAFIVPQYGDYFEATAQDGTLWVLFTANYQAEAGTFQTDPFLAVINQSNQSMNGA